MKNDKWESYALVFFMMQSCVGFFLLDDIILYMNNDAWIIPIVGSVIGFALLKLCLYKFDKIDNKLYTLFLIIFMNTLFTNLVNFIDSEYLYDTPPLLITILLIFTIIYILKNGEKSLFRTSLVIFFLCFFIYIIVTIGLIRQINILNIFPIFKFKISNFLIALWHYIVYTTIPLLIYLKSIKKNINKSYFFNHLLIFIIIFTLLAVFGINLAKLYTFPGYHILKRAFAGAFIERLEKVLAIYYILSTIIPITFIANRINIKKRYIGIILFSNYFFLNNINFITYWNNYIFPIILTIPLVFLIKKS